MDPDKSGGGLQTAQVRSVNGAKYTSIKGQQVPGHILGMRPCGAFILTTDRLSGFHDSPTAPRVERVITFATERRWWSGANLSGCLSPIVHHREHCPWAGGGAVCWGPL